MSFFTNNLEPILDSFEDYNINLGDIDIYQATNEYLDDIILINEKAYDENLKGICDRVLSHFTNIDNHINTSKHIEPINIDINMLYFEDLTNLINILSEKGYNPEVENNILTI